MNIENTGNKFKILTPCSRVYNIERMKSSIFAIPNSEWQICVDLYDIKDNIDKRVNLDEIKDPKIKLQAYKNIDSIYGNAQRNKLLDDNKNDNTSYFYFLDDDNIIHKDLYDNIKEFFGEYDIIYFDQVYMDNKIRFSADLKNIIPSQIDTAQVVFNMKAAQDCIFPLQEYLADGFFYQKMFSNKHLKVKILNKSLCHYNFLKKN